MAEHGVPVAPTPDLTQMNASVGLLRGFIEWMCKEALPYPGRTQPDEFAFSLVQQVTSACSDVADRLGLPSIWREKLNYVDTHMLCASSLLIALAGTGVAPLSWDNAA